MKTFKIFLENNKPRRSGIFPFPIHFRIIKNVIKENLDDDGNTLKGPWLDDNSENGGKTVREISKELSGKNNQYLVPHGSKAHKAILKYTGNSDVNVPLLRGEQLKRAHINQRNSLEETLQTLPINRNLTVWSGIGHDPRHHVDENGVIRSPAFISATHCKHTATRYAMMNNEIENEQREKKGKPPQKNLHLIQIDLQGSNRRQRGDLAHFIGERSTFEGEQETIIHPVSFKYLETRTHTLHTPSGKLYTAHVHHMIPHYPRSPLEKQRQ